MHTETKGQLSQAVTQCRQRKDQHMHMETKRELLQAITQPKQRYWLFGVVQTNFPQCHSFLMLECLPQTHLGPLAVVRGIFGMTAHSHPYPWLIHNGLPLGWWCTPLQIMLTSNSDYVKSSQYHIPHGTRVVELMIVHVQLLTKCH